MKKLLILTMLFATVTAMAKPLPEEINEKVLKAFNETFSAAEDVSWQEYDRYVQASFVMNTIQVRAQYDEEGTLLRTMRYYGEKELLPNIVAKLRKKYADKDIQGVTEVTSDDEVSFTINLRDADHYYVVKSDVYGHLQQTEKFKRADK